LTIRTSCLACSHWLHRTSSCSTISAAVVAGRAMLIRRNALMLMNTVEPGHRYAVESAMLLRKRQTADDSVLIARLLQSDAPKATRFGSH
jgi:hypothetical protein